ncbi:MAG: InlB B-repeat-containing protein [Chitinivibrionia bacterium]|nr:InlB B-repeat-containing protein [Chitinivibrionia bacterium]
MKLIQKCRGEKFFAIILFFAACLFFAGGCSSDEEDKQVWHTVSFDVQGGDNLASIRIEADSSILLPTPTKDGFAFDGWFTLAQDGTRVNSPFLPTDNTTLFARWIPNYIVIFNLVGGVGNFSTQNQTVLEGDFAVRPEINPTQTGFAFVDWFSLQTGGDVFDFATPITADTTIWARWIRQVSVIFDADGGIVEPSSRTENIETSIDLPIPTKDGFAFDGWFSSASGGMRINSPFVLPADITLFARWIPKYTVSFELNGGEGNESIGNQSIISAQQAARPDTNPTRGGFVFDGWYTAQTDGIVFDFGSSITENITIWARWTPMNTVIFNFNGGAGNPSIVNQMVAPAQSIVRPETNPTRNGFTFDDWYTSQTGGDVFDFVAPITENTMIWARWIPIVNPIVSFNLNGGDGNTSIVNRMVAPEQSIVRPETNPTRNGFTFDNWYTSQTGGDVFDFSSSIAENTTIWARWIVNPIVNFNLNRGVGNSNTNNQSVANGATATRPATNPTRGKWLFDDWYTSQTGGEVFDFDTPITENTMIWARWELSDGVDSVINGIEVIFVGAGTFTQGGTDFGNSVSREVSLTQGFWIGKYPITQAQYFAVMGTNPSFFRGGLATNVAPVSTANNPVEQVSWNDINAADGFLERVGGRLPTEAEWEFAARGGNLSQGFIYSGSNNLSEVGWFGVCCCNGGRTQAVGQKLPNELGIYDMSGNVWEWTNDWWGSMTSASVVDPMGPETGSSRGIRGGSWNGNASFCRVAFRNGDDPSRGWSSIGFRVAFNSD